MRDSLRSAESIYLGSGLFMLLVFGGSFFVLSRSGAVDITDRGFAGFAIGFGAFVLVYFLAYVIWHLGTD
ncbi:MAG: hypothetical protein ACQETB_04360 [Halobacteriota archaeon]